MGIIPPRVILFRNVFKNAFRICLDFEICCSPCSNACVEKIVNKVNRGSGNRVVHPRHKLRKLFESFAVEDLAYKKIGDEVLKVVGLCFIGLFEEGCDVVENAGEHFNRISCGSLRPVGEIAEVINRMIFAYILICERQESRVILVVGVDIRPCHIITVGTLDRQTFKEIVPVGLLAEVKGLVGEHDFKRLKKSGCGYFVFLVGVLLNKAEQLIEACGVVRVFVFPTKQVKKRGNSNRKSICTGVIERFVRRSSRRGKFNYTVLRTVGCGVGYAHALKRI